MPKKLTDAFVEKGRKPGVTWDSLATGLGLKVLPSGKKIWLLQAKLPGKSFQSKLSLGEYPGTTLADARKKAEAWRGSIKKGIDPRDAEAEERRKLVAAQRAEVAKRENTFGPYAERYIAARTNRRAKDDAAEIRRMLLPAWHARPIHEITPRDVRELFEKIKRRSAYEARSGWGHAIGIFKLAVHEELISVSPIASLDKKLIFKGTTIAARQRVLSDEEVFALWRAAGRLHYPGEPFYKLLLLTGARKSEIAEAKWNELHPELRRLLREARRQHCRVEWEAVTPNVKVLVVPRERFKSDAEHRLQLSDDALRILEALPHQGDYLFTSTGASAAWLGDKFKRRIDVRMLRTLKALARKRGDDPATVKLTHWINHDLRRVVRTNLSALDVPDHVGEMVLGHGRRGLQRVYDQHKYEPQIREALERWAAKLFGIVGPTPSAPLVAGNVVALRPQGQHNH